MTRYSPRTGLPTEYQTGPFDSAHVYLQWGGKLPGGESWSNGLRFRGPAAAAGADAAAMLVGAAAAVVAYHQRAGSKIGSDAKLSFVKCNGIDAAGHYIGDGTNQALYSDIAGGSAASGQPNQLACCVSLTTGYSRGPAHRGRIYQPMPAMVVAGTGTWSTADADSVKTSFETFRAALNTVHADWKLAVFSRKAGAPAHREITGCQVGIVPDTQRRRRRKLIEAYR